MLVIYCLRHGETRANHWQQAQGQSPENLLESGIVKASELGECLKNVKFDCAFCSDLERTKQTVIAIEKPNTHHFGITYSSLLREIDNGIITGQGKERLGLYFRQKHYSDDVFAYPGGECELDVYFRSRQFVIKHILPLLSASSSSSSSSNVKRVLVVSHGGTIYQVIHSLYDIGIELNANVLYTGDPIFSSTDSIAALLPSASLSHLHTLNTSSNGPSIAYKPLSIFTSAENDLLKRNCSRNFFLHSSDDFLKGTQNKNVINIDKVVGLHHMNASYNLAVHSFIVYAPYTPGPSTSATSSAPSPSAQPAASPSPSGSAALSDSAEEALRCTVMKNTLASSRYIKETQVRATKGFYFSRLSSNTFFMQVQAELEKEGRDALFCEGKVSE